jgi:hypothetical protein
MDIVAAEDKARTRMNIAAAGESQLFLSAAKHYQDDASP